MSKSNAKSTSKSSSASASAAAAAAAPEPIDEKSQPTVIALYDIDDFSAHHCGYCNQNGNISIGSINLKHPISIYIPKHKSKTRISLLGMSCEIMRIEDYQTLIDRGWRRQFIIVFKILFSKQF